MDRRESHQMTSTLQPLKRHVEWWKFVLIGSMKNGYFDTYLKWAGYTRHSDVRGKHC